MLICRGWEWEERQCAACAGARSSWSRGAPSSWLFCQQVSVNYKGFLKQKTREEVPPPLCHPADQLGEQSGQSGVWRGLEEFKGSRKILGVLSIQKSLLNFSWAVVWPALLRYQASVGLTGRGPIEWKWKFYFIFVVIVCFDTFYVSAWYDLVAKVIVKKH